MKSSELFKKVYLKVSDNYMGTLPYFKIHYLENEVADGTYNYDCDEETLKTVVQMLELFTQYVSELISSSAVSIISEYIDIESDVDLSDPIVIQRLTDEVENS